MRKIKYILAIIIFLCILLISSNVQADNYSIEKIDMQVTVQEEGSFAITGKNPLATVIYARKAFEALEKESLKGYNEDYDVIIFIHWTNNLRRNIYERFLLPRGYRYGILNNQKVLMKKWKKGEGIGAIREVEENSSDDDGRAT
jgi:hypothetical protein